MTVFKGYLAIMKKCFPVIALYFIITTCITLGIEAIGQNTMRQTFEATSLNVGIVDADGGSLAKGLSKYIGQVHEVEMLEDDTSAIREDLFYENIHYVIYIPENFEEVSLVEKQQLKVMSVPNVYGAFYIEQRIDTFLNGVSVYNAAGYTLDEGIQHTLEAGEEKVEVQILDINGNAGERAEYTYLLEYLPYLFVTAICSSLSVVVAAFGEQEIRRRMLASSVSLRRQNIEQFLAFCVLGVCFVFAVLVLLTGRHGSVFWQSANFVYYLVNMICFLFVSLALSLCVGIMIRRMDSITSVTTVISLVLCFLGGVFVPLEFLSEEVKRVGRFLPTYWYETNLQILIGRNSLSTELRMEVFKGYGLQLAFALACVAVALTVVKYRSQER